MHKFNKNEDVLTLDSGEEFVSLWRYNEKHERILELEQESERREAVVNRLSNENQELRAKVRAMDKRWDDEH